MRYKHIHVLNAHFHPFVEKSLVNSCFDRRIIDVKLNSNAIPPTHMKIRKQKLNNTN